MDLHQHAFYYIQTDPHIPPAGINLFTHTQIFLGWKNYVQKQSFLKFIEPAVSELKWIPRRLFAAASYSQAAYHATDALTNKIIIKRYENKKPVHTQAHVE